MSSRLCRSALLAGGLLAVVLFSITRSHAHSLPTASNPSLLQSARQLSRRAASESVGTPPAGCEDGDYPSAGEIDEWLMELVRQHRTDLEKARIQSTDAVIELLERTGIGHSSAHRAAAMFEQLPRFDDVTGAPLNEAAAKILEETTTPKKQPWFKRGAKKDSPALALDQVWRIRGSHTTI